MAEYNPRVKLGISNIEFLFIINCQETVDVCKELSARAITVIFANCGKLVFGTAYSNLVSPIQKPGTMKEKRRNRE